MWVHVPVPYFVTYDLVNYIYKNYVVSTNEFCIQYKLVGMFNGN